MYLYRLFIPFGSQSSPFSVTTMTSVTREHSFFYKPGPVPWPAPTLTAHTIIRFASAPPTITAHAEVRSTPSKPQIRKPTPELELPRVRFDSVTSHRSSITRSTDDGYDSSLENSSDATGSGLTALSSDNEEDERPIAKPPGEAGRPQSGGYNLKHAARLKEFDNIKVGHCIFMIDRNSPLLLYSNTLPS